VLASAATAAMLLASGQIAMRKADAWPSLGEPSAARVPADLAA